MFLKKGTQSMGHHADNIRLNRLFVLTTSPGANECIHQAVPESTGAIPVVANHTI